MSVQYIRMTVNNRTFPLELKVKGVLTVLNFTVAIRSCVSESIVFFATKEIFYSAVGQI